MFGLHLRFDDHFGGQQTLRLILRNVRAVDDVRHDRPNDWDRVRFPAPRPRKEPAIAFRARLQQARRALEKHVYRNDP